MKNFFKYFKYVQYLPVIAQIVDAVAEVKSGTGASASMPLSINGKSGILTLEFAPTPAASVS